MPYKRDGPELAIRRTQYSLVRMLVRIKARRQILWTRITLGDSLAACDIQAMNPKNVQTLVTIASMV